MSYVNTSARSRSAFASWHSKREALIASGKSDPEARTILALLIGPEPSRPAPSYKELVETADDSTALRWMRSYLAEACANRADRVPLMIARRHWLPEHRGAYVSAQVFASAAASGSPIPAEKLYTFIAPPTPTDAELLATWSSFATSTRLVIERTARKASEFADPRSDVSALAAPLTVPMTEAKPRK